MCISVYLQTLKQQKHESILFYPRILCSTCGERPS